MAQIRVIMPHIDSQDIGDGPLWGWSAAWHFSDIAEWRRSRMSAFVVEFVRVCVCVRRWSRG